MIGLLKKAMSDTKKDNKKSNEELNTTLHELLLKQQALLLQQSDYISRAGDRRKEEGDAIDLSVLVPGFLKRRKHAKDGDSNKSAKNNDGSNGRGFKFNIVEFIDSQFTLAMKHKMLLALFMGLGIGYCVYVSIISPKVYQSTMTVASGYFDNTYYSSLLYSLESLSENNSSKGLSGILSLDTNITKKVVALKYKDFLTKEQAPDENDSTLNVINMPYFKIDVSVTDNSILPELQDGIFNYLKDNSYVSQQLEIRRKTLGRSIDEYKIEVAWLDTLKSAVIQSLKYADPNDGSMSYTAREGMASGSVFLSREDKIRVNPIEPFNKSHDLVDAIILKETQLSQLDHNMHIVQKFSMNSALPLLRWRTIVINAFYGLLLGLALMYAIVFLRFLRNRKSA
ncbi:hypothetical protein JYT14_00315 [Flavobacteriales bacterium AH-315-E23]|nr:hypothetical protein [Flavobacteriales bacterium AH-315-E23]